MSISAIFWTCYLTTFMFGIPLCISAMDSESQQSRKRGARLLISLPVIAIFGVVLVPSLLIYILYKLIHMAIYG